MDKITTPNPETQAIFPGGMTLAQASKTLPGRPSIPTLWRWCRRGCRGQRLRYTKLGRRIIISATDIADFSRRLAEQDAALPATPPSRTATCREEPRPRTEARLARDLARAREEFEGAGR